MKHDPWIGARYDDRRILILLESTNGIEEPVTPCGDVLRFLNGGNDATFSRLRRVLAPDTSRGSFFNRFALANVAVRPTGPDNSCKATPALLREGAALLPALLDELRPRVIWQASAKARDYTNVVHICRESGAYVITSNHPVDQRNLSDAKMLSTWARCNHVSLMDDPRVRAFAREILADYYEKNTLVEMGTPALAQRLAACMEKFMKDEVLDEEVGEREFLSTRE